MKVVLQDKTKISILEAIFQLLKNASNCVHFQFHTNQLLIQGMDKSHVCLFKISIASTWFTEYSVETNQTLSLDTNIFFTILSHVKSDTLVIHYDEESDGDVLDIELLCNDKTKGDFDRFFTIPLITLDYDSINIPLIDYDAEFSLECKKIVDLTSQLILFGNTLNIICSESGIDLKTTGDNGAMKVNLPIDELSEFSIAEGEQLDIEYSLNYIQKICLTTKLAKEVKISISADYPICIQYDLGQDSSVLFFVAPKI